MPHNYSFGHDPEMSVQDADLDAANLAQEIRKGHELDELNEIIETTNSCETSPTRVWFINARGKGDNSRVRVGPLHSISSADLATVALAGRSDLQPSIHCECVWIDEGE